MENILLFGTKSALILRKSLMAKTFYDKKILKTKIKTHNNETTNFHKKEMPRAGS